MTFGEAYDLMRRGKVVCPRGTTHFAKNRGWCILRDGTFAWVHNAGYERASPTYAEVSSKDWEVVDRRHPETQRNMIREASK